MFHLYWCRKKTSNWRSFCQHVFFFFVFELKIKFSPIITVTVFFYYRFITLSTKLLFISLIEQTLRIVFPRFRFRHWKQHLWIFFYSSWPFRIRSRTRISQRHRTGVFLRLWFFFFFFNASCPIHFLREFRYRVRWHCKKFAVVHYYNNLLYFNAAYFRDRRKDNTLWLQKVKVRFHLGYYMVLLLSGFIRLELENDKYPRCYNKY